MKHKLLLIIVLLGGGGCSSKLQVDIQILKRAHLRDNPSILFEVLSARDKTLRTSLENFSQKKAELQQQVTAYVKDNPCLWGDSLQAKIIIGTANQRINDLYTSAFNDIISGLAKKDSSTLTNDRFKKSRLLKEALTLVNRAASQSSRVYSLVADLVNKPRVACPESYRLASYQQQGRAIVKQAREVAQVASIQHPLANDPLASYAVTAPDSCWKSTINHTLGRTVMGNADIAVVMESNEGFNEYTIKGIRNDASQATKAVFSLLNATVETIAKAYGVGLAIPSASSDTVANFTRQSLQTAQGLKTYKHTVRLAQVSMIRTLLDQRKILATPQDTTKYKAAIDDIKTSFSTTKKKLIP